ncbi:MAG: hypothetical protein RIR55_1432 [Bacteroidota bacterium]|jgi:stage II sporulation protein D
MKSLLVVVFILLFSQSFNAQNIRIGIFTGLKLKEMQLKVGQGTYWMQSATENSVSSSIQVLDPTTTYTIRVSNAQVQVLNKGQVLLQATSVLVQQKNLEDYCNWTGILPVAKMRSYEGDFEMSIVKGELKLINSLDIETYLEGVVSSEGGFGHRSAYYEAQAVISRTYAFSNLKRHQNENFALCERVHCQAYFGKRSGSAIIDSAVRNTKGYVLLNQEKGYYPTFFHANCGGQTCEPQYIWNEEIQGLQSFQDTFCVHTKQATWIKSIPLSTWTHYLADKYHFPLEDSMSLSLLQSFHQPQRMAFYLHPVYGIPLRDLREQFKLKSTYFDAVVVGQEMILYGKGFGHGVGLCQEGAMQMAKKGYTFDQILRYYYPGSILSQ